MNHRTTNASRRSITVISATNTTAFIQDASDHDEEEKLHGSNAANGNHSEDSVCFSPHQKHKDYQYDRNTVLIGIAVFVIYSLAKYLHKTVIVDRTASGLGYVINTAPLLVGSSDIDGTARLKGTIGLPKSPPAVVPLEGFANKIVSSTANGKNTPPRHSLDLQNRNGTLVTLVHIGKTGGSALRDLIDYAVGYCKTNYLHDGSGGYVPLAEGSLFRDAHLHERTTLQKHMCALARITNSKGTNSKTGLIHLDRNLDKTESGRHFLVPIRNPVHRLVSWFHYELHFQTVKQTRYSNALNELIDPSRCNFSTANEVFLGRRGDSDQSKISNSSSSGAGPSGTAGAYRRYGVDRPAVATPDHCYRLSRECLSGAIPCYGHNFFNYEFYLEDILVRILQGVAARKGKTNNNETAVVSTATNIPRVDVIRAERSWDDLNRTLLDWTGFPMTPDMDFFYLNRKPFDVDTHDNDKTVSVEAARSLCETICPELVAYSKIVKYAANLSPEEKAATRGELDATCGFSVEAVCGKAFRYRKIRADKESELCEPRKQEDRLDAGDGEPKLDEPSDGNEADATNGDARRRLAYLRGDDLPSC